MLVDVVPESRLPFVQISLIYQKTAAKTLKWYQGWLWRKETRPEKQKNLFRHSVAPGNFPLKFLEKLSGVSNCIFVNGKQRNLALYHGGFAPCQWQAAMGQYFIYRGYSTYFIAVPCRCGLRGGYIELVGFNDQLRSRVKTYLSARSCPSTIGQLRIMYVMWWNGTEVPNERAASNPSPQFPIWIPGKTSVNTFR